MKKILKNKTQVILILILLLAAFLRLYNISHYMTFLGDEGRDALVVQQILEGNLTLLGPRASAGDFFTGPIYYYMMAPFLWLAGSDPVGPAIMIALLSVATVYLIYRLGKEWFGERAGLFAAALYAVSPLVIAYSRSSWNPNPMPFFSLLILYLLWRGVQNPSWKLFVISGILFGIAMQLHYMAVFLGIIMAVFVLGAAVLSHFEKREKSQSRKGSLSPVYPEPHEMSKLSHGVEGIEMTRQVGKQYLQILGGFFFGFSLFLLFEIRHGFPNTRTIYEFIFVNNAQAKYEGGQATFGAIVQDVFFRIFGRLVTRYPSPQLQDLYSGGALQVWHVLTLLLAIVSIVILFKNRNKLTVLLFSLWLFMGILLFGFYKKPIHDYYFEFMFPLPFLLVGNVLGGDWMDTVKKKWVVWVGTGILVFFLLFNLWDMPFRYPPNNQKQQAEKISEFVLSKTNNEPFNFALLTKGNSDHAYRYFFHIKGHDPVAMNNMISDPKRETVTSQLLLICDYPDCEPLGNSLFEVAGFGRADIAGKWEVGGVTVYRLVHYKGEQ